MKNKCIVRMSTHFPFYFYFIVHIFIISSYVVISEGLKSEKIRISHRVVKFISYGTSFKKINIGNTKRSNNVKPIGSNDIHFILYNRMVPEGKIIKNQEELQDMNFLDDESSKFIIHGWMSSGYKSTCQSIKDAYLEARSENIFVVNWAKLANKRLYFPSLKKMADVADYFADFLKKLIEMRNVEPSKVHLIGHSLGAHISGMVGKRLQENGTTIGRITGLDPAFPGFHASSHLEKLSKSDAAFVDIIHTSGGTLGISESIGHVDFYPNGGSAPMPGCKHFLVNDQCSHSRSWEYFAESITHPFFATKCDTMKSFQQGNCTDVFTEMGESTPTFTRGNYYLNTNYEHPYSLGMDGRKSLDISKF